MEKEFHRRHLPHLYFDEGFFFITARLANTIPISILHKLKVNQVLLNKSSFLDFKSHFLEYDSILDKTVKTKTPLLFDNVANIIVDSLRFPDNKEYQLVCYTIMPNHFHFVIKLLAGNKGISRIMQSIKGISARRINLLINKSGKFWQDESYDRWLRNDIELYFAIKYTLNNPVSAGLVENWHDWKHTYCHPNFIVL